jgi:penicillin amidase
MRARSLPEFRAAMDRWGAPTCNQVYADTSGTVARLTCGVVPRRRWTGLLPVPGDGGHEWDGVRLSGEMPWEADPARGFVYSANENNLPTDWDHTTAPVGFEWADPYRADRIRAVLAGDAAHSLAASQALQTDVFSAPALKLAAMAPDRTFAGWDGYLRVDSPEAALCETWWARHLKPALLAVLVQDDLARRRMLPGDTGALLDALDRPGPEFGPDPEAARERMLRDTLAAAQAECAQRMGPDRAAWGWGALHHAYFTHALSPVVGHVQWDAGPVPLGGSAATPMAAGYRPSDFRLLAGASVRMVVDVGDWDRSVCINAPGQSGDPRSPHYADLMGPWSRGEYVPMLYTDAAIRDAAENVLTLQPS